MSKTAAVTREQIEKVIHRLNEVENARLARTVEETISDIGKLIAADAQEWISGQRLESMDAERELERVLYEFMDDYHRDIERMVVDPPFASFAWRMRSAKRNFEGAGCSIIEVNNAGQILRSWVFVDPAPFKVVGMQV